MPLYEVKVWVTVEAENEAQALVRAAELLDRLPPDDVAATSIEGEGAIYEIELEEE